MSPNKLNVVAAFDDAASARLAIDHLERRGVARSHIRLVQEIDLYDRARIGELRAEMQDEVGKAVAGPSVGLFTSDQANGAFPGAITGGSVGVVLGAVVGVVWANVDVSAISELGRVMIGIACGMVACATIGFVVGGAVKPRMEFHERPGAMLDERELAGQRSTLISVETDDTDEAHLARSVLERSGALRVDSVDPDGEPLPPQADHPRPADPPEWWTNGGRGKG